MCVLLLHGARWIGVGNSLAVGSSVFIKTGFVVLVTRGEGTCSGLSDMGEVLKEMWQSKQNITQ